MKHNLLPTSVLGMLFLSLNTPSYSQSEIINNPEIIRLNSLLRKHTKNTDSLTFYANELLNYSKENKLKFWEYTAYVTLGNSERIIGNTVESNHYNYKALTIAKSIDDLRSQHIVMNNIAMNHKRLRRNDSAYYYFKKLDAYHSNQLEILPASMAKMNIGLTFLQYQELDSAEYYLSQSRIGFKEINNQSYIAQNLNLLGEIQLQKGGYNNAIEYADSSLKLSNENNLKHLLPSNYFLLSRVYTGIGDSEKAKEYATLAAASKPRQMDFSESRIDNLNEDIRIQKAKDYESRLNNIEDSEQFYKWKLFTALVVILVLTLLLYFFYRRHTTIAKDFKGIQLKLNDLRDTQPVKEEDTEHKVIQLKSKASVNWSNILYVKSDGHYVEYYLDDRKKPEVDRNTMLDVLKSLPPQSFVRIHKSYIVNINRVKIINSNKVMLDTGEWINLSRVYKQDLKKLLNKE